MGWGGLGSALVVVFPDSGTGGRLRGWGPSRVWPELGSAAWGWGVSRKRSGRRGRGSSPAEEEEVEVVISKRGEEPAPRAGGLREWGRGQLGAGGGAECPRERGRAAPGTVRAALAGRSAAPLGLAKSPVPAPGTGRGGREELGDLSFYIICRSGPCFAT